MTVRVAVLGAGGHANDVLDCFDAWKAIDRGAFEVVGLLADLPPTVRSAQRLASRGLRVVGGLADLDSLAADAYVIAIGYPHERVGVLQQIEKSSCSAMTLVDPRVIRAIGCEFGQGVVVLGPTRLSPFVIIGDHVLISYHVALGHGCRVDDFASVMPGAIVGGEVTIGRRSLIGAGAIILEDRVIGEDAIVGAGAVVTADVSAGVTVIGVPARPVE